MALEEFTGDLRNGPVELPCHTQRPAMQRGLSSRKIIFHDFNPLTAKRRRRFFYQFLNIKNNRVRVEGNRSRFSRNNRRVPEENPEIVDALM